MNVKALHAGGWTIKQIAEHLGFHPATVSSWLKNGGPPPKRSVPDEDLVIDDRWQARIGALLAHNADLQGIVDHAGDRGRGLSRLVSDPHALPALGAGPDPGRGHGHHAHRDRAGRGVPVRLVRLQLLRPTLGLGPRAALLWVRLVLEPDQVLVFRPLHRPAPHPRGPGPLLRVRRRRPRRRAGPTAWASWASRNPRPSSSIPLALAFARHHDLAFKACDAGDAKRKGKIERPFPGPQTRPALRSRPRPARGHRRAQPPGTAVGSIATSTPLPTGRPGVAPSERFETERHVLGRLPPVRFDTAVRDTRRVGRIPLVEWDTVFYSAPPDVGRQGHRGPPTGRLCGHRAALFGPDGGPAPSGAQRIRTPVAARAQDARPRTWCSDDAGSASSSRVVVPNTGDASISRPATTTWPSPIWPTWASSVRTPTPPAP